MNELVLNELSLVRFRGGGQQCAADNRDEARTWMSALVQTLTEASSVGFPRSLRTTSEFLYQDLAPGYSLIHWRNDQAVNRDERRLFNLYSAKSPLLDGVLREVVDRFNGCQARFDGVETAGLLASFVLDGLAVSLPSDI